LRFEDAGEPVQNPEVMATAERLLVPMVCLLLTGCGNDANGGGSAGNTGAPDGGGAGGGTSGSSGRAASGGNAGSTGAGGGAGTGGVTAQCSYPEPAEEYSPEAFFDDFEGSAIDETKWQIATWSEHGGQTGRERTTVEDGNLKLVLINDASQGVLSSAIQTRDEFLYGRWEARLRASSCDGVLNSMYTIDWDDTSQSGADDDGTKQEIDIELLTKSFTGTDGRIHFALHAAGLDSTDTNPDLLLGFDPSADFHVYGYEITPDGIHWFVDDQVLWSIRYDENPITIDAPYMLKFNFWTGGEWVQGPPPADVECVYLIDWVRFTPCLNAP
jgi:beta-glucanase (GH16 family)